MVVTTQHYGSTQFTAADSVVEGQSNLGATFGVGLYSDIDLISSLCVLMARGAVISLGCVIGILPAFLMIFDKLIMKTTRKPRYL